MDLAIFEKHSQRLGDAGSAFDSALEDTENNFVHGRNETDTERRRLLKGIDSHLSNIDESVCEIGEKIEKFKSSEGIKYRHRKDLWHFNDLKKINRGCPNKFQSQTLKGQTNNNNGGITMKLEKMEKQSQRLSDASSEFASALKDAQANFGADPNESEIRYRRLTEEIKRNLSDVDRSIRSITEKIEQLKSFEGIL